METLALGVRQLRQLRGGLGDEGGVDLQWQQIGVGEVAVVIGLLLGAHGPRLVPLGVVEPSLLDDLAAPLQHLDLTPHLELDGPLQEAEGVDVLDLGAGAEGRLALGAHRDVGVHPEGPLLHVAVADADPAHQLVDLAGIGHRLLGGAQVGLGDDLEQRCSRPVQIDPGVAMKILVQRLARVLFQVGPGDADLLEGPVLQQDLDLTLADDGVLVLADLVALRQVGVEIILTGEDRTLRHLRVDRLAEAHGESHRLAIEHRQDPGQPQIDGAGLGVRLGPEAGRGPREDLGLGRELGVDLQPDDGFPLHGQIPVWGGGEPRRTRVGYDRLDYRGYRGL